MNAGSVTNAYDAMNNRIGQTYGTNSVVYVVNPNAKLPQVLMSIKNGVTNYYVYGAGLLYQVTETTNGEKTLTYHYDYRGSTVALTDDTGAVKDRFEYSLYATMTYRTGNDDIPFLFNGRYSVMTDPNGLLYMSARFYAPFICRFLSPDPSGFSGGLNFYAYADLNPVSYLDPFGLDAWTSAMGGVRALGGGFEAAGGYIFAVASGTFAVASSETIVGAAAGYAGAVGGAAVGAHGVDEFQAGIQQLWTGNPVDSLTSQNLQAAGMSQNTANLTDAGISLVGSFGAGLGTTAIRAQSVISAEAANANVFQQAAYYEIGQNTVSDDANTFYSLWANPVDRGLAKVVDQGWFDAGRPQGYGYGLGIGKTFGTGPTPLGGTFGVGGLIGGGATAGTQLLWGGSSTGK